MRRNAMRQASVLLAVLLLVLCAVTAAPARAQSFQGLGDLPGGTYVSGFNGHGVSADGNTVVGISVSSSGPDGEAFRWTKAGGMVGLGDLTGGSFYSDAWVVSSDRSVVVGGGTSASGGEAFRWTQAVGMVGLGDLPGGEFGSRAYAVSTNGEVVIGYGRSASGQEAFRWTQAGGMVGLGDLSGGEFGSQAFAVSGDGSIVVGTGTSAAGQEAFIWDAQNGMRSLKQVLTGLGLDLAGWTLTDAKGISADGKVIVGNGINPNGQQEGWVADLRTTTSTRDDRTRLLWRHADGRASVWVLSPSGVLETGKEFGPFAGWSPQALAVADDNRS